MNTIRINEYLRVVSYSEEDIGSGAAKLSPSAKECSQEVLAEFEPTIIWLIGGHLNH